MKIPSSGAVQRPLLSIVISNYNYEAYLAEAIESALAQTYPNVEVVVVDDGSTDGSREVIAGYGEKVRPVHKENGGLISALNAGIAASKGDVIQFLDADDLLEPDIGQRVMSAFEENPELVKVQFRLRVVDEHGTPLGALVPPAWQRMPSGDLRRHVTVHRSYPGPPTTGIAVSAEFARNLGPFPEEIQRLYPDHYLHHASAIAGPIKSIDRIGSIYRVHQKNMFASSELRLGHIRGAIEMGQQEHEHLKRFATRCGLHGYPKAISGFLDPLLITSCMVSLKLEPEKHPVPEDTLLKLSWRGVRATMTYPDLSIRRRGVESAWFVLMAIAPRRLARWLAMKRSQFVIQGQSGHQSDSSRRRFAPLAWLRSLRVERQEAQQGGEGRS